MGALSNLVELSMLGNILGGFTDLEDVLSSSPVFYLYFIDLTLAGLLQILLAFGLFKLKSFVPVLMAVLFLWTLGMLSYILFFATPFINDLIYLMTIHLTEMLWLIMLGALTIKTLKDRKHFQA